LQDLLDETGGAERDGVPAAPAIPAGVEPVDLKQPELSPYQFNKKVEKAIDEYIRPMLQKDGGDLEIIDIKDTIVYCRLAGACAGCAGAAQTLKMMVEKTLKDSVDQRIRIIQV
jgi:Fe-S cluster biogenesis protein NfuA